MIALNLILLFILIGCEKEFDNVIENSNPDYQVKMVTPSDSIQYNPVDSLIIISIAFNSAQSIRSVYCDVYASDNSKINNSPVSLLDNGKIANGDSVANDGSFANKIPLSKTYPNGIYNIKYFVTDNSNSTNQVALGTFKFDNRQSNFAPIISNDIVDPDTAIVTDTTIILTSINVIDQNGLSDILIVYFVVYRPDGTTNGIQNFMFDDGDLSQHGDQFARDGIYSLLVQITSANDKGTYKLEFRAKDRGGKLSNIITHSLLIQ